jgi:hypothetical protein
MNKMNEGAKMTGKLMRVMTKAKMLQGVEHPATATEYLVDIVAGRSVHLFKEKNGVIVTGRLFVIGDSAEYDSFNLSYVGVIDSITPKTVTIVKTRGSDAVKHRLSMYEFCWRNFNFDEIEMRVENVVASMNI